MELTPDESKQLAIATTAVAAHYNYAVDPKYLAWAGLLGTMGIIYGPRIALIRARRSAEKKERPAQAPQSVAPATQTGEPKNDAVSSLLNSPDMFASRMQ